MNQETTQMQRTTRSKKMKQAVGYVVVFLIFLSSIVFYITLVQPAIVQAMVSGTNKNLSNHSFALRQATNETIDIVSRFEAYSTEYTRQDCEIPVKYDIEKQRSLENSVAQHLSSSTQLVQNYGILYASQLQEEGNSVLISTVAPRQKVMSIAGLYNEVPELVFFLTAVRSQCAQISSFEANKTQVMSTFCQNFTQTFAAWKEPNTQWIQDIWNASQEFQTTCSQQKTFQQLLESYIQYSNKLFDSLPDRADLRSQLETNYENVQRAISESQQRNLNYLQEKQSFSHLWYLLSVRL